MIMETNDDKKTVGAPKQMEGGKRHNVYLDDETVRKAQEIGESLSDGIRKAVREYNAEHAKF